MLHSQQIAFMAITCFVYLGGCSTEKNPYTSGYQSAKSGNSTPSPDNSGGAPSDTSSTDATSIPPPKPAEEGKINQQSLTAVQSVCQFQAIGPEFATEFGVLCVDGKPTQDFADLLTKAHNDTVPSTVLKKLSTDVNSVSEFLLGTSYTINSPYAMAIAKRDLAIPANFVEGSATVTRALVSQAPGAGGADLGSNVVRQTMKVTVGPVTVNDINITEGKATSIKDGVAMASTSKLKSGETDNQDNLLANLVLVFVAEGDKTKVVAIAHQKINNRNQGARAETTALALARRMSEEAYKAVNQ